MNIQGITVPTDIMHSVLILIYQRIILYIMIHVYRYTNNIIIVINLYIYIYMST
jgi:hypothetical protein